MSLGEWPQGTGKLVARMPPPRALANSGNLPLDTSIVVIALMLIAVVWLFNALVRMRNQVRVAWSDVDVQLARRHDLVPMLVEVVKSYASHESALFERVGAERSAGLLRASPARRTGWGPCSVEMLLTEPRW